MTDIAAAPRSFAFGTFVLFPEQQLLMEGDRRIAIGGRALDILTALVERPGEVIGKDELRSRVWPSTFVEESNLKVNVAALRRALGEASQTPRFIATVNGRGYRFVSPVEPSHAAASTGRLGNLPNPATRIVGRADAVAAIGRRLEERRLVSIVGTGGIGKTTVALEVGRSVVEDYEHGVWFVDLASLADPALVPGAVARALGLTVHSQETGTALGAYLRDRRLLLVLDNCEHVIEAAASAADTILADAAEVRILATSREPLRARGEQVLRLEPLAAPARSRGLAASEAMTYSAIELFVERAAASLGGFELSDDDAPLVADLCRGLDGVALAIELAATRVAGLGLAALSSLLEDRFRLLNQGERTAPARQLTLNATLDWSHDLLSTTERVVLRRVSAFAGGFSLESAVAVAGGDPVDRADVIEAIANLVAKSLIAATDANDARYRLLETTRAYAQIKLAEQGERDAVRRRHAEHELDLLDDIDVARCELLFLDWSAKHAARIDDLRAALNWTFAPGGDVGLGTALVVAAIPLWSQMSLLDECRVWVERALAESDFCSEGAERRRMTLHAALGSALLYTRGLSSEIETEWTKTLQIADRLGDHPHRLRALWGLAAYRVYVGDHRPALKLLSRHAEIAAASRDLAAARDGTRLAAVARHYVGEHAAGRSLLEQQLADDVFHEAGARLARFQLDHRVSARCSLSHILWVQGFADQAREVGLRAAEDARSLGHAISLGNVLALAVAPEALYRGDIPAAERAITELAAHVAEHGFVLWAPLTECLRAALSIAKGEARGVEGLQRALDGLRGARFGMRYPGYLGLLAQSLGERGRMSEAHEAIEAALDWSRAHEELWCLPELLRVRGELHRREGSSAAAEAAFHEALEIARDQGAAAWELRTALSLSRLWRDQAKHGEAETLLLSVYGQFTEGFGTADLTTAQNLLDDLRS